jgi:fructokinase
MTDRKIYSIGETVYDIIFKNGQPVAAKAGGSTLNSTLSMGRAGLPVAFISEFANDQVGDLIASFLESNGVSSQYVYRHSDGRTSISLAMLNEKNDASYTFYKQLPVNRLDVDFPVVTANDIVLFGSFFSISKEVRHRVIVFLKQAREAGALMIYDPNFRKAHLHELEEMKPMIFENMSMASIVRGSNEDFEMIFGAKSPDEAYAKVSEYCKYLIVTANSEGAYLFTPKMREHWDVAPLETVSTIGAGDNFNAGLIFGLYQQEIKHIDIEHITQGWSALISSGVAFAGNVCMSYDNYISEDFAAKIKI